MLKKTPIFIAAFAALLLGGGCAKISSAPADAVSNAKNIIDRASSTLHELPNQEKTFSWKDFDHGVRRGEQTIMNNGWRERTIIYRFDPAKVSFNFVSADQNQKKTIRAWRDDLPDALFIINGVYFHNDGSPVGSLRINGADLSKASFDADKSGLIELDDAPSIVDTAASQAAIKMYKNSAQSYPFLIKDGAMGVATDSQMLARRSFIGTDEEGYVYLGSFPDGDISLFEMSKQLKAMPIKWKHVLNLDGGPSTSFLSRIKGSEELEDGYAAVPNVIVVHVKK